MTTRAAGAWWISTAPAGRFGDTAFLASAGGPVRVISGSNDENLLRADGPTAAAAWRAACDQARSLGMFRGGGYTGPAEGKETRAGS